MVSPSLTQSLLTACHILTWVSSGVVVGITAYFLANYHHNRHLIFQISVAGLTFALWIPYFILLMSRPAKSYYWPLHLLFSYLWLTAFIFAVQDYNESTCGAHSPAGGSCKLKWISEAFMLAAFLSSLAATVIDILARKRRNAGTNAKLDNEIAA